MKRVTMDSSSRRKSTINVSRNPRPMDPGTGESPTIELEKLEQEITLVLQQIDTNLSRSNAVINDRLFPILRKYASASTSVWNNVSFWKYFLEEASGVEVQEYDDESNAATQRNTAANAQPITHHNGLLEEDEEDITINEEIEDVQEQAAFKKPILKALQPGEETGTWTAEQQKGLSRPTQQSSYNIQSSTPQLASRPSLLPYKSGPNNHDSQPNNHRSNGSRLPAATALRFDSNDTFAPPPPMASANIQPSQQMFNSIMNHLSPVHSKQEATHLPHPDHFDAQSKNHRPTIRQPQIVTLEDNRRILVSPKKSSARTPMAESLESRRRSSMIQDLINSSPTLPEPPVLLSEIGRSSFGKSGGTASSTSGVTGYHSEGDANSNDLSEKDAERLSPIQLNPTIELTPHHKSTTNFLEGNGKDYDGDGIQRFPRTPIFSSGGRAVGGRTSSSGPNVDVDIRRTPMGVRIRYGDDDSDIQPPDLQNELSGPPATSVSGGHIDGEEEDEVPLPDLETIELPNANGRSKTKRKMSSLSPSLQKKNKLPHDDDNVFIDSEKKDANSSTVYHSVINQDQQQLEAHEKSTSYSNLFGDHELPVTPRKGAGGKDNSTVPARSPNEEVTSHNVTGVPDNDTTDNSNSSLGPVLSERWRNLTKRSG